MYLQILFLSMINKNKISSNLLLLSVASMLVLPGLISHTFSSEVFAQTNSPSDNNTADVNVQPNINAENIFNTKQ